MRLRNDPPIRAARPPALRYNGQKHLIRDVIARRCCYSQEASAMFGEPARVTTVDRFQGQQNDYILLSLVRQGRPFPRQSLIAAATTTLRGDR